MAVIEKFLGQRVEIPEDCRYHSKQGLWAQKQAQELVFGLTHPALVLAGGINDIDWLAEDGDAVSAGQDVIFAITGKILYIAAPVAGVISFNPQVKQTPSLASEDPYRQGWLFRIKPEADREAVWQTLTDAPAYVEALKGTEGFKNPQGLQGGVSGICKAVYSGIREQKF